MPGQEFYNNSSLFQQPKELCSHSRQSHMSIPVRTERKAEASLPAALLGTAAPAAAWAAREGLHGHRHCATKLMDTSHWEHAAVCAQNMGEKLNTKKGRSSRWGAKTIGSSWHKVGIKNLQLLRTCLKKLSSASPILTSSQAKSIETVFIDQWHLCDTLRVLCSWSTGVLCSVHCC